MQQKTRTYKKTKSIEISLKSFIILSAFYALLSNTHTYKNTFILFLYFIRINKQNTYNSAVNFFVRLLLFYKANIISVVRR